MAKRAVQQFGKAGGAGAHGSEGEDDPAGEDRNPDNQEQPAGRAGQGPPSDRERAIMDGGPQDEAGFTSFKHGSKTFNSQDEVTAYLDELNTGIRDRDQKLRERTVSPRPADGKPAETPPQTNLRLGGESPSDPLLGDFKDEDFILRPREVLKQVAERVSASVTASLTSQYQAERSMERWWNEFYTDNKEYSNKRDFVGMVLGKHATELNPLSMAEAKGRLAELVQEEFIALTGGDRPRPRQTQGAHAEAPSGERVRRPAVQEQPGVTSLSAAIKARSQARQHKKSA